jgi:hypothetical protein
MPNWIPVVVALVAVTASAWFWFEKRDVQQQVERLDEVNRRIDAMTPKGGARAPQPVRGAVVRVHAVRHHPGEAESAFTAIRIDEDANRYPLPSGWRGRLSEPRTRIARYDAVMALIKAHIARKLEAIDAKPEDVRGEIVLLPGAAGAVPPGDMVGLLRLCLELGMTDVVFERLGGADVGTEEK